jgi:hypothetical protein
LHKAYDRVEWVDKSDNFMYLLERVIVRLNGWKENQLSMGAEEILLKAVIQSIADFAMAILKIPKNICNYHGCNGSIFVRGYRGT